jgi:hypothetical protein
MRLLGRKMRFYKRFSWNAKCETVYRRLASFVVIYYDHEPKKLTSSLDKTIVHTNGGVICKFDKAKWQRFVELSKKNQQKNQQEGGK